MLQKHPWIIVGLILLLTFIFTRALIFWKIHFPLGDGGFFYVIVKQVSQHFWPDSILYNGHSIPFAYPPLAFWVTSVIQFVTRIPLLSLFIILPLFYNAAFIFLAVLIIKKLSNNSPLITLGCSIFFILSGKSFLALTFGGGVVRGLGSIVFLGILLALISDFHKKHPIWFSLLPLAAIMIHPEWGIHSLLVIVIVFIADIVNDIKSSQKKFFFYISLLIPTFVAGIIQLCRILQLFGPSPLLGALNSSGAFSNYFNYLLSRIIAPDMGVYTLLGLICGLLIVKKIPTYSWLFVHFVVAYIFLPRSSRSFMTFDALFMISLVTTILPILYIKKQALLLITALLIILAPINFYNALLFSKEFSISSPIFLPPGSTFLSMIPDIWPNNMYAEWLPAVTDSNSVLTVQGAEWVPATYRQQELLDYSIVSRIGGGEKSVVSILNRLNPQYLLLSRQLLESGSPILIDIKDAGYIKSRNENNLVILEKR